MVSGKLDIKTIFILILGGALVLSFIFRPSKEIDMYENELNALKAENKELVQNNDSLMTVNDGLTIEIRDLMFDIDSTQAALIDTEDELKDLENGKGKVSGYVKTLNADGIAESLTEYLDRKK